MSNKTKYKIKKIRKRDGRVVPFDKNKITEAIWKAIKAVGGKDKKIAEKLSDEVVNIVNIKFKKIPCVEDIQDIVEDVLMKEGHVKVAKAYILYRKRRTEIREAKKLIGVYDELKLNVNAIKVLKKRYLLRDKNGRIIETPRQLFIRVAKYIALVDIFYDKNIYDKNAKQKIRKLDINKKTEKLIKRIMKKLNLNRYDIDMLKRTYNELNKEKRMKITFGQLIKQIEKKWKNIEKTIIKFYGLMVDRYFIPNSPTLMNASTRIGQLSACFVLPVEDSIESIFEALKNTAKIHQSGGGTGFNFSKIRPKGDIVQSTKGIASGPISFMKIFDVSTEVIKQGGKRRGANMGILRIDHPDILEFITSKNEENKILNNFNISVAVTDKFMNCLKKDCKYKLINPRNNKVVKEIDAKAIFEIIVTNAWKTGDPGLIFIDEINRHNPTPGLGKIESTNPCGEQPLLNYESCNLGSINLSKIVKQGKIDWDLLKKIIFDVVHFMDNVIDANKFPLEEIKDMTRGNRKIGIGVMGFADLLFKLGIKYDSKKALDLAEEMMKFISYYTKKASIELSKTRGRFPNYNKSIYLKKGLPKYCKDLEKELKRYGIRNSTTTTIAPTGTISIIAGCSSGIEPSFAIVYVRNVLGGAELIEINPIFEEIAEKKGFYSEDLLDKIAKTGTLKGIKEIPDKIKKVFVTAMEISPEWHVKMQAVFQKYVDNAVSKTVNLPNDATPEDVKKIYLLAHKLKCKGITIYRYGSKEKQVLYIKKTKQEKQKNINEKFISKEEGYIKVGSEYTSGCSCG